MSSEGSFVSGRSIPDYSEGEAVKWLDTVTLGCTTKPQVVLDELPGIVGGITALLRGKIHTGAENLHQLRVQRKQQGGGGGDGAATEEEGEEEKKKATIVIEEPSLEFRPTPLYASLFQAVATLSNHVGGCGGNGGCLPKSGELFLSLLALAAVTPHYSQSAFIAAKSILRQSEGRGLFTVENYSMEMHAWLKGALLRGWDPTATELFQNEDEAADNKRGQDAVYARHEALTAVEERKIAFYCLDRMVQRRGGVVSLLSITAPGGSLKQHAPREAENLDATTSSVGAGGSDKNGPQQPLEPAVFLELLLELSELVDLDLVPLINSSCSPTKAALSSPSSSPDYYLSVATDFMHRVRKLSVQLRPSTTGDQQASVKTPTADAEPSDAKVGNDFRNFVSPLMAGGAACPTSESNVSRALAFDTAASPAPQAPSGGDEKQSSTTGPQQSRQQSHPAIPSIQDIRAGGRAGDAKTADDGGSTTKNRSVAEARLAAAQCLQTVKQFGGKGGRQMIDGPKAFAIMEELKENREIEMEALSVRLATAKSRNALLADEISRNDRTLTLLQATQDMKRENAAEGEGVKEQDSTGSISLDQGVEKLEASIAQLEAAIAKGTEKNDSEVRQLREFLRHEEMEHFSRSIQIETKYGRDIARRAKELALLQQTSEATASPSP